MSLEPYLEDREGLTGLVCGGDTEPLAAFFFFFGARSHSQNSPVGVASSLQFQMREWGSRGWRWCPGQRSWLEAEPATGYGAGRTEGTGVHPRGGVQET